jgi:hypothetical protein
MKRANLKVLAYLKAHASPETLEALKRSHVFEAAAEPVEPPTASNHTALWPQVIERINARYFGSK